MSYRLNALQDWLETQVGIHAPQLVAITNDASFRRYFRVKIDGVAHIVMDAPPDKEDCGPFIDIAQRLQKSGLNAPRIIASNHEQGFLLLTDLGSQLYLPACTETQVDGLYGDAIQALIVMQKNVSSEGLPLYDHRLLHTEMDLFTNWLVDKHLKLSLSTPVRASLESCFELLSSSALSQPQVFVHRDYHSRNLMIVPDNNPGILDFQDAVKGAITYDLVSLLRDCYIAWPLERVQTWAKGYYTLAQQAGILKNVEEAQFVRWFDLMGIQRHLKASGIFARLYHRDGKSGYLKDIPRTLNYIVEVSANYPELSSLHQLVSQQVLPNCQAEIL
jgi:aminoglycoside/choline kinase family phosphotransferase